MLCAHLIYYAAAAAAPPPGLATMPQHMVLHAPFTPFTTEGKLKLNCTVESIEALAAQAAAFGVTTVWVPGSMGQFDTMTLDERKALIQAWVPAAKKHGLYLIAHVGSTAIGDAVELAQHAQQVGAPALGSVPPYYETTQNAVTVASFLGRIGAAAPQLPLFYYHIPSLTRTLIKVGELFDAAVTAAPTLAGVKYVSSDASDWFDLVQRYNSSRALMYAPEPKLSSFGLGLGRGAVLAEDFFAPTYLRMHEHFLRGHHAAAAAEQHFKLNASNIMSEYGGSAAERSLYRAFPLTAGMVMGPGRLPQAPFEEANWPRLHAALEAIGFWKQLDPPHGRD